MDELLPEPLLRQCPDCLDWLPEHKFESNGKNKPRKKRCQVCHNKYRLEKEGEHIVERKKKAKRYSTYDLTHDQYLQLHAAQKGVCWICKHVPSNKTLHIDHDHLTNKVRGLLCHRCNFALGFFKDDIDRLEDAIQYLLDPPFARLVLNAPAEETE